MNNLMWENSLKQSMFEKVGRIGPKIFIGSTIVVRGVIWMLFVQKFQLF